MKIEVTKPGEPTQVETFSKNEVSVGRVRGNDIVLPAGNVSKRHARIVAKDSRLIIVDLDSQNGTKVNGTYISSPQVLGFADEIDIGEYTLRIQDNPRASWNPVMGIANVMVPGPGPKPPPTIAFTLTTAEAEPMEIAYSQNEVTIGRAKGNDIWLQDTAVSKRHARIVRRQGKLIAIDLNSQNGTWVNGRPLKSPLVVKLGDKIYVGSYVLTVTAGAEPRDPSEPDRPPPPPPKPIQQFERVGPSSIHEFVCHDSLWEDIEAAADDFDQSPDAVVALAVEQYLRTLD